MRERVGQSEVGEADRGELMCDLEALVRTSLTCSKWDGKPLNANNVIRFAF